MMGFLFSFLILVMIIAVIYFVGISNRIEKIKIATDQAKADIEIYMVKRYDVIMNSLEVAKKFMSHEDEIFSKIHEIHSNMTISELSEQSSLQDKAQKGLLALAEQFPELKSQEVMVTLQKQIADENEHFAAAKRMYNSNVTQFNQAIVVFPSSIVASMKNVTPLEFFKDEDALSKRDANVVF
ncbi:LemA family protein [Butyrivibrio proteoclasticus]|uniref:LemA family protein n=1 Tax=Butyrivibrio proteoclasticus TaxID=43305 RepID=UPI0006876D15|nr:LemA family protein [Butyrivibrio proteoclasticus]